MCLQKFKTTIFVPKLTEISSVIEVDIDPHDSESDLVYKLIKKIGIIDTGPGLLLSKKLTLLNIDWSKLICYERISRVFP
jgi:hypothetical protein